MTYEHVEDEWDRTHLRNGYDDGYQQAIADLENLRQGRNRVDCSFAAFDEQQRGIEAAIKHLRATSEASS